MMELYVCYSIFNFMDIMRKSEIYLPNNAFIITSSQLPDMQLH